MTNGQTTGRELPVIILQRKTPSAAITGKKFQRAQQLRKKEILTARDAQQWYLLSLTNGVRGFLLVQ